MPNLLTLTALLFSWIAIVILLNGHFYLSFAIVLMAFIIDALDGFLARRLKQDSPLGRQLDSNTDIFVFIAYPALSFYLFFGLKDVFSVIITFVYIASGVFRLARFNVLGFIPLKEKEGVAYPGLPVYFNHFTILILLALRQLSAEYYVPAADALILLNSLLMLAKFPFRKPRIIWPFILVILLGCVTMLYLEFYAGH